MSRFADGPDHLTLIPTPHDASIRRHNPPARGSDSQIPADSGHHPRRSPAAQQAENSLPAGAYHRRCGDRTARPQPGVARQQHHPLRYGRTALHHVPLRPGYGHVGFPQERHPKPRIRTLYVLCSAPARYSGGILHPGIFDLLLDPAGRALRLADPDRLPHRQQTGHRPRQGRHDRRRRHGHYRYAGPAAADGHSRHGHRKHGRHVLVPARHLGRALHRIHHAALPADRALVLQALQRQHLPIHFRAGHGLSGRLPGTSGRTGADHRRLPRGSGPQPPHPAHLAPDEPHRIRRQRHLHPLLSDRRRHADRLPGFLPRLGEYQGRCRDDRPDHRRQIHRRAAHSKNVQTLQRPADGHLRPEQRPRSRHARSRDGGLQRHRRPDTRRRTDPSAGRERAERHDPDDPGHLHHFDLRHSARRPQHRHQRGPRKRRKHRTSGRTHPDPGVERRERQGTRNSGQRAQIEEKPQRILRAARHRQQGGRQRAGKTGPQNSRNGGDGRCRIGHLPPRAAALRRQYLERNRKRRQRTEYHGHRNGTPPGQIPRDLPRQDHGRPAGRKQRHDLHLQTGTTAGDHKATYRNHSLPSRKRGRISHVAA